MAEEHAILHKQATEITDSSTTAPTKRHRLRAHFKKWWWAYLIALVVVVLVVVLPIVYVAYPNTAQDGIDSSKLSLSRGSFLNPSPDGFDLELDTVLISDSSYHPNLRAFNGSLHVGESETPFAYIAVPGLVAQNNTSVRISQPVTITDQEQFARFCILALSSETYTIHLRGQGNLKLGGLPTTSVRYNQSVESKGLNSLAGLSIETFFLQLDDDTLPNGANSNGTVFVPNASPLTLAIGETSFAVSVNGTPIANATVPDLTLVPGDNTFTINVQSDLTAVTELLQLPAYGCGKLPVDIVGISSTYGGQLLPYFTTALRDNSVRTTLDIAPALQRQGLEAVLSGNCTV